MRGIESQRLKARDRRGRRVVMGVRWNGRGSWTRLALLIWETIRGGGGTVIKGVLKTAIHRGRGHWYMRVHEVEEGGLIVRGGVVVRWVVLLFVVADEENVSVELEFGVGGVGRTPIRGSWR
jgi:hypothetical protein